MIGFPAWPLRRRKPIRTAGHGHVLGCSLVCQINQRPELNAAASQSEAGLCRSAGGRRISVAADADELARRAASRRHDKHEAGPTINSIGLSRRRRRQSGPDDGAESKLNERAN